MTHLMCDGWTGALKAVLMLISVVLGICGCMDSRGEVAASEKPFRKPSRRAAAVLSLLAAQQM